MSVLRTYLASRRKMLFQLLFLILSSIAWLHCIPFSLLNFDQTHAKLCLFTLAYGLFKNYQNLQGHCSHHYIFVGGRQLEKIPIKISSSSPLPLLLEDVF